MASDHDSSGGGREPKGRSLSPVLIHLLKGVLYREQDSALWDTMRSLEGAVVDYFRKIGLELAVDEPYGFAYLKQGPEGDEGGPRLIQRRPLSVAMSILCVLLRKKMVESEAAGEGRVVLARDQIVEMMRLYGPRSSDEARADDRIDQQIRRAVEFDLLKELDAKPPAFEIRPVIKALVDADWVASLDEKLKAYKDAHDPA